MAKTAEAIAGFFRTVADGEAAREALLSSGFTPDQVSFVAGDTRGDDTPRSDPSRKSGPRKKRPLTLGSGAWSGSRLG